MSYTGKRYKLKPEAIEQINTVQSVIISRQGLDLTKHIQDVVASEVRSVAITLTPTQILDLDANPVELLPTLGANQTYDITSVCSYINFNTTPYTVNATKIAVTVNGYTNYEDDVCDAFVSNQNTFYKWGFLSNNVIVSGFGSNATLALTDGTDLTDGDSPITFFIQYRILTLN